MRSEIRDLRNRLELHRDEFSQFLGLTSRSLMNIELGTRNPNRLTKKIVRYLASIPKAKAVAFVNELNRYEN